MIWQAFGSGMEQEGVVFHTAQTSATALVSPFARRACHIFSRLTNVSFYIFPELGLLFYDFLHGVAVGSPEGSPIVIDVLITAKNSALWVENGPSEITALLVQGVASFDLRLQDHFDFVTEFTEVDTARLVVKPEIKQFYEKPTHFRRGGCHFENARPSSGRGKEVMASNVIDVQLNPSTEVFEEFVDLTNPPQARSGDHGDHRNTISFGVLPIALNPSHGSVVRSLIGVPKTPVEIVEILWAVETESHGETVFGE
jgi:hypothetical protein